MGVFEDMWPRPRRSGGGAGGGGVDIFDQIFPVLGPPPTHGRAGGGVRLDWGVPLPEPGVFAPRVPSKRELREERQRAGVQGFLESLAGRKYWTSSQIRALARGYGLKYNYARQIVYRLAAKGILVHLKRGVYEVADVDALLREAGRAGRRTGLERINRIEGDVARGAAVAGYAAYLAARGAWRRRGYVAVAARRAAGAVRRVAGAASRLGRAAGRARVAAAEAGGEAGEAVRRRLEQRGKREYVVGSGEGGGGGGGEA